MLFTNNIFLLQNILAGRDFLLPYKENKKHLQMGFLLRYKGRENKTYNFF